MEWLFAALAAVFSGCGAWLVTGGHLLRIALGLALMSMAANLIVFAAGTVTTAAPAIAPEGALAPPAGAADPLPQALVLTAIVIGFGLSAFVLALGAAANRMLGTADPETLP